MILKLKYIILLYLYNIIQYYVILFSYSDVHIIFGKDGRELRDGTKGKDCSLLQGQISIILLHPLDNLKVLVIFRNSFLVILIIFLIGFSNCDILSNFKGILKYVKIQEHYLCLYVGFLGSQASIKTNRSITDLAERKIVMPCACKTITAHAGITYFQIKFNIELCV